MNIFLHLIIQSIAQLRAAYKEKADVIIENCGIKLFLGSNNYETAKEFVDEVGSSIQLSKADLMSGKISFVEKSRVKIDKVLYQMKRGECFVKMMNVPPIHSFFEMFYKTPEYQELPEFDLSSIVAPKLEKKEPSSVEESRQEEDIEERRIKEARAALEQRKAELLKRMMETIDDEEEDDDSEEDDYDVFDEELENVVDCIRVLTDNELDLLEAAIKNGYMSESWLKKYSDFEYGEEPMDIINRFLKLGIVQKTSLNNYMILFSLELFKRARKRL